MKERLIQFECKRNGTLFYYQSSMTLSNVHNVIEKCPSCGSTRFEATGREYEPLNEREPIKETSNQ